MPIKELPVICPNCPNPVDAAARLEEDQEAGELFFCAGPVEVPNFVMLDQEKQEDDLDTEGMDMAEYAGHLFRNAEVEQTGTFMVCGAESIERIED